MKKSFNLDFAKSVQNFFEDYIIKERGLSNHTMRSYRDTFILLLNYFQSVENITADKIELRHLTRKAIGGFLNWLETERHNTGTTRNQRFAAIRSYCMYMIYIDPNHMATWEEILSIRHKRYDSQSISHLTLEEMKCLLEQIDQTTVKGRRDLVLLSLLYNAGLRVQELIDLTPRSIHLSKPYIVEIEGKGRKHRVVPLNEDIIGLIRRYVKEYKLDGITSYDRPLFSNSRGEKLTTPGVSYIIHKYVDIAKNKYPDYFSIRVTPHVFRHSRAMHLLQAGINLVYIRDFLGHESVTTTEVYAKADPTHVRSALETAYASVGMAEPQATIWEKDAKLKEYLKGLG